MIISTISCSDRTDSYRTDGTRLLEITGEIKQQAVTVVEDGGFADGDAIGVYVVDYDGTKPGTLRNEDNRATNVRHTYNGNSTKWTPAHNIYWRDDHTPVDIYAYYPFDSTDPSDVNDYRFTIQSDQSSSAIVPEAPTSGSPTTNRGFGGYEASDFLWCKTENVAPTSSTVRMSLSHIMSSARITLAEGSGFNEGEWDALEKQVVVMNTHRDCSINLATGTITPATVPEASASGSAIIPAHRGNEWRAIVLPQTIAAGTTIFALSIGGAPYKFTKQQDYTFTSGKLSTFTIRIDKNADDGKYKLTLIGESIAEWENDFITHDATAREYVVVNSTGTHLKDSIMALGKDYTRIKNLKVTGEICNVDFYFMNSEMSQLQSLNLREARVVHTDRYADANPDYIPVRAFQNNKTLFRIILPEQLKVIDTDAFSGCSNLVGSLDIPEGVTHIKDGAFYGCSSLTGTLTLPSTLEYIGGSANITTGAFSRCNFNSELQIPEGVTYIGNYAFYYCTGLYGELHLPNGLTYLGRYSFANTSLSGSLRIPPSLKKINNSTFERSKFDGNLYIPDGVESIGENAFEGNQFRGELYLPNSIEVISEKAFSGNHFSGTLRLPPSLPTIGNNAFANNSRLSGTLVLPEGMVSIGAGAFANCSGLEGLVLNANLETIGSTASNGAFSNCYSIRSIICQGTIPPNMQSVAFNGVSKTNFIVEVPEGTVPNYQTAIGWSDFKQISAHHELVCVPSEACALSSKHEQVITVKSEGDWEVENCPSWCKVNPTSGTNKTAVTLTISDFGATSGDRKGSVVFRLKGKDYRYSCAVTQYGYKHSEDEVLTLQKATKGRNGGINIVFIGDGYSAKDLSEDTYLQTARQEAEHFFAVEPYKTYRDYFNVYVMFPLSTESGIGSLNKTTNNRFNTTYTNGVGLKADYDEIFSYVQKVPTVNQGNIAQTLIVVIPNTTDHDGYTQMWNDGRAISFCPVSSHAYPYDTRGVVQHEVGGHAFGKLADENVTHNAFIDNCHCGCCSHTSEITFGKTLGWYDNISLTNKADRVPWSHLIYNPKYSNLVDIYEGGFKHSRGIFRSEQNSCMNNKVPYFNTISRESIVKRIMRYAGETFSYTDFFANDKITSQQ